MIRNVCANAWVCDRLHVKKYVMPTKLHLGFVGIFGKYLSGEAMQSINTCEAPACHFREISYLRMDVEEGWQKQASLFQRPKISTAASNQPQKEPYISSGFAGCIDDTW